MDACSTRTVFKVGDIVLEVERMVGEEVLMVYQSNLGLLGKKVARHNTAIE